MTIRSARGKMDRVHGGGYLVYLSDGDVPFFGVSFLPFFSRRGYETKAMFLKPVVKTFQKEKSC